MSWLDPLRSALDGAPEPVRFFLRDDDAGWADERLFALLGCTAERGLPIDLAVIPKALSTGLASSLRATSQDQVGLHQHGLGHVNHEPTGRKSEFGLSRGRESQLRDIAAGRRTLGRLLGSRVDPIFTPPWNRCSSDTGRCLVELGFPALSRESQAEALGIPALGELPISVDWFAHRKGKRLSREQMGTLLAGATGQAEPVGVMFHHAAMDKAELVAAAALFDVLASHENASVELMRALVRAPATFFAYRA